MCKVAKDIKYYLSIKDNYKYSDIYKYKIKHDIITIILKQSQEIRKSYFIVNNYFILTNQNDWSKQCREPIKKNVFNKLYSVYSKIDNISFDEFLDIQRQLYISEHVKNIEYRSYIHSIRQKCKDEQKMNELLKKYYLEHLLFTEKEASAMSIKKAKGKKTIFVVSQRKTISLCDKSLFTKKEILSFLHTRELQNILNPINNKKSYTHFTKLEQRKAFIENEIFYGKIIAFLLTYSSCTQKVKFLPQIITKDMIIEINKLKVQWTMQYKSFDN
jgi:hypothetical protein